MLYIIGQYKKLFTSFIVSKLNGAAESASWTSESNEELNSTLSFKDALTNALKNNDISQEEAKELLNRLNWEKNEAFKYTTKAAKILVDELKINWTDTWINEDSFKERLETIVKVPDVPTSESIRVATIDKNSAAIISDITDVTTPVDTSTTKSDQEATITPVSTPVDTLIDTTASNIVSVDPVLPENSQGSQDVVGIDTKDYKSKVQAKTPEKLQTDTAKSVEEIIEPSSGPISTKEVTVSESKEEFMWIDTWTLSKKEVLKEVNVSSIEGVISKWNLWELLKSIKQALWTGDLSTFKYTNVLWFRNYSKLIPILENAWYNIKSYFGTNEVLGVVTMIDWANKTQELIAKGNLNYREDIKILLDYNVDWELDNEVHFYTKEKQFLEAIRTEQEFNNLLLNLGYKWTDDFNSQFEKNYYLARNEFKTRLAIVLDNRLNINPVELLNSWNAIWENIKLHWEILKSFDTSLKFQELEKKDKSLAYKIKYQWAWAILWAHNWAAVSFDIKELTENYLDSISIWVVNWVVWFILDKEIFEDSLKSKGLSLHTWVANFIPYIAGARNLHNSNVEDFKDIFPTEIKDGVDVTLGWSVFLTWPVWIWVSANKINEETSSGIEKMKGKMSESLDNIFAMINEWKSFEELGINDTDDNKNAYNRLTSLYEQFWEAWLTFLKEWALNNYERELYDNAEWFKLTW